MCKANSCPLGNCFMRPKHPKRRLKRKIYLLGHGLETNDVLKAGEILLIRDHKKIANLRQEYKHGKLGVYMVPPMFYGELPEVIKPSENKVEKYKERMRGDIAERTVYHALQNYYKMTGDDVLIVHSHKFLNNESNNEKDFIVINLSKGELELIICASLVHLVTFFSNNIFNQLNFWKDN